VLHLLLVILPLGLAAAVSPVMTTEQAVLLAAPGGRRTASLYAAGTGLVLAAYVAAVILLGQSLSLPRAPQLDARLDLLVGGILLALSLALRLWYARHPPRPRTSRPLMSPPRAFAFGVFSMSTNVTSLALVLPAAKEIAASGLGPWWSGVAGALLVVTVCLPAWGPVVLVSATPGPAGRLLGRLERLIDRRGRTLVVVLVAAAGAFFVARGALRLLGG
jgi:hypothetical protein